LVSLAAACGNSGHVSGAPGSDGGSSGLTSGDAGGGGNEEPAEGGSASDDAGSDAKAEAALDASPVNLDVDAGPQDTTCSGPCPASNVKHLVIIVQENHTFDDHFGAYCTATPGSNPTCNDGPSCCEAMPAADPLGVKPTVLTDKEHAKWDPNHTQACELAEIDNGLMDHFSNASASEGGISLTTCGGAENVAIADPTIIQPYWQMAAQGALADRYFQSVAGQSSSNDMYLVRGKFVFLDNAYSPKGAIGETCDVESTQNQYTDQTIGDLLTAATVPWTWFYEGYAAMVAAKGACPAKPSDCAWPFPFYPCAMDPSDVPFNYYASTVDNPDTLKDLSVLTGILQGTGELPAVSFVKALGYHQEHPGNDTTLSAGVTFVTSLIQVIESSRFRSDTLVVLTYDEGGGYFDHVAPPPTSTIDGEPYGMRLPVLAVGPLVKTNYVSHVQMEHASLIKFIEWNWLGQTTGQLGTRDTVVNNIGSLLDPTATGVTVPEN
jgi:phospholipase C